MRSMVLIAFLFFTAAASSAPSVEVSGSVRIDFTFNRQVGMSTNQFAVWVENEEGDLIQTVFVTSFITAKGGWQLRDDNLMIWHERSNVEQLPRETTDVFTGATPSASQTLDFVWDCRDSKGNRVGPGLYRFMIEGSMSSQSHVLFEVPITLGDSPAKAGGTAKFIGEGSVGRNMIENVTITYQP